MKMTKEEWKEFGKRLYVASKKLHEAIQKHKVE